MERQCGGSRRRFDTTDTAAESHLAGDDDLAAPPLGDGAMGVGLLTILILSIGGLVLVALTVAGVTIATGRSRHQCRA